MNIQFSLERHHLRVHQGMKLFKCNICDLRFHTKYVLNKHYIKEHKANPPKGLKMFPCNQCSKSFLSEPSLIRHKVFHRKEIPYDDVKNNTFFSNTSALLNHNAIVNTKGTQQNLCQAAALPTSKPWEIVSGPSLSEEKKVAEKKE